MPHGYPDFGINIYDTTIKLLDSGELASRLGCISKFDRAGTVIFMDDGKAALYPYTVNQDALLQTYRTIDGALASNSAITCHIKSGAPTLRVIDTVLPYYQSNLVGLEFKWKYHTLVGGTLPYIQISMVHRSIAASYLFTLTINLQTGVFGLYAFKNGSLNVYPLFGVNQTISRFLYADVYHHIKIVYNTVTGKFSHLSYNGYFIDLSAFTMSNIGGMTANTIELYMDITNAYMESWFYLGDIIITTDELERIHT